jgi:hypothetical protein
VPPLPLTMSPVAALICQASWEFDPFIADHFFSQLIFEVRMSSDQYRKLAADSLERARHARKSEDIDAWLLVAEDWLRLAVESDAPERQSE